METIKLVIWDLDETFWKGTLSDGEVEPVQENIALVRELTDRGIVNSICSKNDFQKAWSQLCSNRFSGISEYFVFPSIDWSPKGERIKKLIADMNLRPVNVLFVDDNHSNLREASFVCPEISTVLYRDLRVLMKDTPESFRGKDDRSHSRLKQYRILQEKVAERSHTSSNEEFLAASAIRVTMIETDLDYERIHEMIHRNNQLNFTKNRISLEEVQKLFSDPGIRSGVVHVRDKYGDHGIVGCYAEKDGRLLQFVFSCRILGMGVEQYVYQQLSWPDIEIVGEVAGKLTKGEKVGYINTPVPAGTQIQHDGGYGCGDTCLTGQAGSSTSGRIPKLIVYGYCPLRPIWSYLEPRLPGAVFNAIFPDPSTLNLGVLFTYSREYLDEIVGHIRTLHASYTFDENILRGKMDYLLITLTLEPRIYRYTRADSGHHFYSIKLDANSADPDFISNYSGVPVTEDDVRNEMEILLNSLPSHVTVIMTTVTEVEFSVHGQDSNYQWRKRLNQISEELASEHPNLRLVDIRKHAKAESDFFEPMPNHYNRAIGFAMTQEILEIMGVATESPVTAASRKPADAVPANALKKSFTLDGSKKKITAVLFALNSMIRFRIEGLPKEVTGVDVSLLRGRMRIFHESTPSGSFDLNLSLAGRYHVQFAVTAGDRSAGTFKTGELDYSEFNCIRYFDPLTEGYETGIGSMDKFCRSNASRHTIISRQMAQIAELASRGVTIADYFNSRGITEISLLICDEVTGRAALSFITAGGIAIKHAFTTTTLTRFVSADGRHRIELEDINGDLPLSCGDHLLFCRHASVSMEKSLVQKYQPKIHFIDMVLAELMTRTFAIPSFLGLQEPGKNPPMVIAVRCGYMPGPFGYDRRAITNDEKRNHKITVAIARDRLMKGKTEGMSATFRSRPEDLLKETLKSPEETVSEDGLPVLKDWSGRYLNIKNGFRVTEGSLGNMREPSMSAATCGPSAWVAPTVRP